MTVYVKIGLLICGCIFVLGAMFGWNAKPSDGMKSSCVFVVFCEPVQSTVDVEIVNRTITINGTTHTDYDGSCVDVDGVRGAFVGDSFVCMPFDEVAQ